MTEKEPRGFNFETIISNLESSKDPIDRYGAESLREVYFSGGYICVVPPNTPNERGLTKMVRVVRITESNNEPLSIVLSASSGKERHQLIDTLLKVTKKFLVPRRVPKEQEFLALNTLKEGGFNTIASMAIIENSTPGEYIVETRFPRVFMNLDPNFPPSKRNALGLAVAAYFLKTVPIK